ncbi:MAG TPA: hypothetical protein VEK73_15875 [Xanthobacteraceae bacterium]|nr:hypothetical protein [Xanthobacteraceae bacterium]
MPDPIPVPITPPPGIVVTETGKVAAGRWMAGDAIHFVRGLPQKIGGWVQYTSTPTSGQPRASHAWRDNQANEYIAVGTYRKLYVYDTNLDQNDITPFRRTSGGIGGGSALTNPFTTNVTAGTQSQILVDDPGHGVNVGDTVIFTAVGAAVGGITAAELTGTFLVLAVVDANQYVFDCSVDATSAATGGGTVDFEYEITVGTELGAEGTGFGVGPYGQGTYGTARTGSSIFIEPRVWSLDHFGQLLLATYNTGQIYVFDPTQGQPWPRAVLASSDAEAPTTCRFMFVTQERFVVALCTGMVLQWCSQGDYTTWTPTAQNTANARTLTVGTKLVAGRVLAPFISLIWSDAACYLMQWTGSLYVYNTSILATECGLISPGAAVCVNGIAYWMGFDNFFMYDGSVHPIFNVEDIRKSVFDAVDKLIGTYQCHAIYVPKYNRIDFHYTVAGDDNPTLLARYHINDQCWAPGVAGGTRCSGTHFQQGDTRVIAFDVNGLGYQHDNGNDAAGLALPWSLALAPFALDKNLSTCEINGIESDFKDQAGTIDFTLTTYDRLGDAEPEDSETETVSPGDQLIDWHSSGRYLSLAISSSDLGSYFRWGVPQAYVNPLGLRR